MAKIRHYVVSFAPAERTEHGFRATFNVGAPAAKHRVSAASLPALEAEVRKLAVEYGRTCSPVVLMADPCDRKPAGFDAWRASIIIIDVPAAPVTEG